MLFKKNKFYKLTVIIGSVFLSFNASAKLNLDWDNMRNLPIGEILNAASHEMKDNNEDSGECGRLQHFMDSQFGEIDTSAPTGAMVLAAYTKAYLMGCEFVKNNVSKYHVKNVEPGNHQTYGEEFHLQTRAGSDDCKGTAAEVKNSALQGAGNSVSDCSSNLPDFKSTFRFVQSGKKSNKGDNLYFLYVTQGPDAGKCLAREITSGYFHVVTGECKSHLWRLGREFSGNGWSGRAIEYYMNWNDIGGGTRIGIDGWLTLLGNSSPATVEGSIAADNTFNTFHFRPLH